MLVLNKFQGTWFETDPSLTCASGRLNTSWLVTEATRQKWLHLVVLMCMMGDPGSRNLFHLIPEVRAQWEAETAFSVGEDEDGDDDEEEGGNRGDRRSVAFPRVTDKKEVIDAPQQEIGQVFFQNTWIFFCLHTEPAHDVTLCYKSPR